MYSDRFSLRIALVVLLLVSAAACRVDKAGPSPAGPPEDSLARIQKEKVLRVGYVIYPPAVQKDPKTGKLSGHFVDAVEELGHLLDARIEYHEATWGTFAGGLETGQYDLSIAPTFRTVPRALAVAFTRPLFYVGNSAIARKGDTRFHSLGDLATPGLKIAVTQGEAGHEYAKAHLPNAQLIVLSAADQSLAFTEVSSGRADVALGDAWAVAQYAARQTNVVDLFAAEPYNLTSVGWAVRPDDLRFLNFLNTALDFFDDTGQLARWERAYQAPWYHKATAWRRN